MIWGKDPEFDHEALGTHLTNNKWINSKVQCLPSKEGGLSLLHWQAHVKAIEALNMVEVQGRHTSACGK